jgi:hypothetical protein
LSIFNVLESHIFFVIWNSSEKKKTEQQPATALNKTLEVWILLSFFFFLLHISSSLVNARLQTQLAFYLALKCPKSLCRGWVVVGGGG